MKSGAGRAVAALLCAACCGALRAEEAVDAGGRAGFAFAIVGSAVADSDRTAATTLRAIDRSDARFVVHFDLSKPSNASCADAAIERRRALLDASAKPAIPVTAAVAWADCGTAAVDPLERLERLGDAFFANDESLGQARLPWLRQSALTRFHRYRENLRWQVGSVLFASINLPDNNNNFRTGAGRNGEFEDRLVANHAWVERTFRIARERRLAAIVIFVDAAPRFATPLKAPDPRIGERDGFYEWKLALRAFAAAYNGEVLLVQGRHADGIARGAVIDRPLLDAGGRPIANVARIALDGRGEDGRWLRVDVDAAKRQPFTVTVERVFDDPSGELYGPARPR